MENRDFLLRQIEKISTLLAFLIGARKTGKIEEALIRLANFEEDDTLQSQWREVWLESPEKLKGLLEDTSFTEDDFQTLLTIRRLSEEAGEIYETIAHSRQALICWMRAREVQHFLHKSGFVVWGEENKWEKYQQRIDALNAKP